MERVQITGCATFIGSKNLNDEEKEALMKAPNGQHVEVKVKVSELKGKLVLSKAGSLMCRFSLKSDDIELVAVPDKVSSKDATPEEIQAQAEALL